MRPTPPQSPRARRPRLLLLGTAVLAALIVTQPWRGSVSRNSRVLMEEEALPGVRVEAVGSGTAALGGRLAAAAGQREGAAGSSDAVQRATSNAVGTAAAAAGATGQPVVLEGRAACVAAATTGPVPVHGWVQKAGPLPMHLLDGPVTQQRHQAYFRWRDSRNSSIRTQEALVGGKPGGCWRLLLLVLYLLHSSGASPPPPQQHPAATPRC